MFRKLSKFYAAFLAALIFTAPMTNMCVYGSELEDGFSLEDDSVMHLTEEFLSEDTPSEEVPEEEIFVEKTPSEDIISEDIPEKRNSINNSTDPNISAYTDDFNLIAYSHVAGIDDPPGNTAEHFENCCYEEYPFTSLKGDLRLTSDGRIIMCHDPGFTLDSKGRITDFRESKCVYIDEMTYDRCMDLQYAKQYYGEYVSVCDFESYINICAEHNKNAYITIRSEHIDQILDEALPVINKYKMHDKCMFNSFTYDSLKKVHKADSSIPLSWVIDLEDRKLTKGIIDKAASLGNCTITLYKLPDAFLNDPRRVSPAYAKLLSYAQSKNVPFYSAIIKNISHIDSLRELGISGAQLSKLRSSAKQSVSVCSISGISDKTYNGKKQKQKFTVTLNGKKLKEKKDYTVSYKNNIKPGIAKLIVTGKGRYKGRATTTFLIKPAKPDLTLVKGSTAQMELKWSKSPSATGYEIRYGIKGQKDTDIINIKNVRTTSRKIDKLKSKKTYQVSIRAYKRKGGRMLYSPWSKKTVSIH